jgi:hypothetical protein
MCSRSCANCWRRAKQEYNLPPRPGALWFRCFSCTSDGGKGLGQRVVAAQHHRGSLDARRVIASPFQHGSSSCLIPLANCPARSGGHCQVNGDLGKRAVPSGGQTAFGRQNVAASGRSAGHRRPKYYPSGSFFGASQLT